MVDLFRRRDTETVPQLAGADALRAIVDAAPATLFVTDPAGEIVYRNAEAQRALTAAVGDLGEGGLARLREAMKHIMRTAKSFPAREAVQVGHGGRELYATVTVARIPDGYVVTWFDSTAEVERMRLTEQLADEMAASSASLTTLGDDLSAASQDASTRAGQLTIGTGELTGSIREIAAGASAAAASTGTAVRSASEATESVAKLSASSAEIATISRLITAIAEQTNLLALNATIEAARAGAAGKGFAVVAAEVKELSRRTAEATERITRMIGAIQSDSDEATAAIRQIVDLIAAIEAQQTTIASAVEQQSATSAGISEGIEGLAAATAVAAGGVASVRTTAEQLAGSASRLRELLALR